RSARFRYGCQPGDRRQRRLAAPDRPVASNVAPTACGVFRRPIGLARPAPGGRAAPGGLALLESPCRTAHGAGHRTHHRGTYATAVPLWKAWFDTLSRDPAE